MKSCNSNIKKFNAAVGTDFQCNGDSVGRNKDTGTNAGKCASYAGMINDVLGQTLVNCGGFANGYYMFRQPGKTCKRHAVPASSENGLNIVCDVVNRNLNLILAGKHVPCPSLDFFYTWTEWSVASCINGTTTFVRTEIEHCAARLGCLCQLGTQHTTLATEQRVEENGCTSSTTTTTTTTTTSTTTTVTTATTTTTTTTITTSTTTTTTVSSTTTTHTDTTTTTITTSTTTLRCGSTPDPTDCNSEPNSNCCAYHSQGLPVWQACPALCGACDDDTKYTQSNRECAHASNTPVIPSPTVSTPILIAGVSSAALLLVFAGICIVRSRRKLARLKDAAAAAGLEMNDYDGGANINVDDPLIDLSGETITIAAIATEEAAVDSDGGTHTTEPRSSKFVAPMIRLGAASHAATGLPGLMGVDESTIGQYLQEKILAIVKEFEAHGSDEDQQNLRGLLDGTYRNPPDSITGLIDTTPCKCIDDLMQSPEVKLADLGKHHVLAIRLYTTSSYQCINNPLRTIPPTQPHPFAATTYFISEGIKKLRAVAAERPGAFTNQVYYRGLKGMALSKDFMKQGGTEFACMSTSASQDIAVEFATSQHPLIFKFATSNFMSRGADISCLSVYPEENEALYPPLTYLSAQHIGVEVIGGVHVLVATVIPTFPS